MSDDDKTKEPKKTKPKNNTMDITLINSKDQTITISGPCTDIEIKSICKAISHSKGQKIEIT